MFNLKFEIFKKNFKEKLNGLITKVGTSLFKPFFRQRNKRSKRDNLKHEKRREYNLAMGEEELMRRYAKHLIKYMINHDEKRKEFVYCDAIGADTDRRDENFILTELGDLHRCKDEYLSHYWWDTRVITMESDELVAKEKRLNDLLWKELEKIGVTTEYKEVEGWGEYWRIRTKYVKSLVITLP